MRPRAPRRATERPVRIERRPPGDAPRLIAVNKPFDVLSQFTQGSTPPAGATLPRRTLADLALPEGLYPAGRLDRDSEGLLLLTDDGRLQHRLADPSHHLLKRYHVQVEGCPSAEALEHLRTGVALKDGPARALQLETLVDAEPWPRDPPIRVRRHIPTTWLMLGLDEGRNRQVRRMTAAIGHPTLRLIRMAIGPFDLDGLPPGTWRDVTAARLPDAAAAGARGGGQGRRGGRDARPGRPGRPGRAGQWPRSTE